MIEVLISALLVGLVVVGTLTGFNSATKASYDERAHAQATVCAQQDEERMRGLTTQQLSELGTSSRKVTDTCEPYVESSGYKGTIYTITSTAAYVNDKTVGTACSPEGSADYLRTTSSVKWAALRTRKEVTQSSIVTNPIGASLLVKVENQLGEGAPGVTVTAVGESTNQTLTTNTEGCAIFASLVAPSVTVTVTKTGWVDHEGEALPPESLKLVTGQTTSVTYQLGEAGAINAGFKTTNSLGNTEPTVGDTFVAFQKGITRTPEFMLEGTISSSVGAASADYKSSVLSPKALFPFRTPPAPGTANPYTVYAGDCPENNPTKYGGAEVTAQVEPNGEAIPTEKLTVPPVDVSVWTGTETTGSKGEPLKIGSASLTNTKCGSVIPTNYYGKSAPEYVDKQPLTSAGHLTYYGQPYGTFSLCVTNGTSKKWTGTFINNSSKGPTIPITNATSTNKTETIGASTFGNIYLGYAVGSHEVVSGSSCP
jgi:type II secretory pathway pseudopilin PulG